MPENDIPIEVAIAESKDSITRYVNGLCQKYKLHPIIMLQILQEIIYENRINTMSQQLMQMRMAQAPTVDISTVPDVIQDENE